MQIILTEEEYNILKDLVNKAENYEKLYNELISQTSGSKEWLQ